MAFWTARLGTAPFPSPTEQAVSFGKDLQRERESRGVSLESVSEGTKVSPRYLQALETGDHAQLPGGVFNRGIVQSYCRFLGLNEAEWLTRFAEFSRTEGSPDWTEFAQNVKRNRVEMGPRMRLRWWGVLLLLLALGAAGWALWRYVLGPKTGSVVGRSGCLGCPATAQPRLPTA